MPTSFLSVIPTKESDKGLRGAEKLTTMSLAGYRSVAQAPSFHLPSFWVGRESPGRIPCVELEEKGCVGRLRCGHAQGRGGWKAT